MPRLLKRKWHPCRKGAHVCNKGAFLSQSEESVAWSLMLLLYRQFPPQTTILQCHHGFEEHSEVASPLLHGLYAESAFTFFYTHLQQNFGLVRVCVCVYVWCVCALTDASRAGGTFSNQEKGISPQNVQNVNGRGDGCFVVM